MSGSHTPTPWKVSPGHAEGAVTIRQDGGEFQRPVAEVWHNGDDPKANAEFIVTAVNSYASSQAEIERLMALEAELWRLSLVIESAVRNADWPNHADVLALIKSIKRPDAALSGSKE